MAEPIVIKIALDPGDLNLTTDKIKKSVTSALDAAIPAATAVGKKIGDALGNAITDSMRQAVAKVKETLDKVGGAGGGAPKIIKDTETAMLRLAQASARLQQAQGNLAGAELTLKDALAKVTKETTTTLGAQTQLISVQAQLSTAAGKADTAILREAQALARLKQIAGDTPGAIKTLSDALAKVGNAKSLAAVRAELQKTYLETNYNNSPLIGAIRNVRTGFEGLPPVVSKLSGLVGGLFAGLVGGGLLAGLEKLGSVALNAAIEIDKSRQTLVALTGSADAANRKLAELRDLAQKTPGLTTRVAVDAFTQLKATGQIAEDSINKLVKGIGRLNAVFTIDDAKQFSRNIVQIFQQMDRADVKEALTRVPIFEQLLESAFGTKDLDKLRKLKESGKLTLDSFASGLAEAINTNPVLANVQESLGSRFEKAKDNILVALEPLGAEIGKILLRFTDELGRQLEASRDTFSDLIESAKDFGRTLTDGVDTKRFFDLQNELETIKGLIDFVNGSVLFLKDSFELLGTLAIGVVKQIALTVEQSLLAVLSKVPFVFDSVISALNEDILRLSGDLSQLENRFNQGFINTREFKARRDARDITVDAGNAVPIDPNTGRPLNPADALPFRPSGGSSRSGSSSSSAESKARQLREALLTQQKTFIEQSNRLQEDANKRELEQFKNLYDDKAITIREFYDAKLGLSQANIGNEINALQQEIAAQQTALNAAKAGTPEKIRLETELFKLRTQLTLKTRELTDAETQNQREAIKALEEEKLQLLKETQALALKLSDNTGLAVASNLTDEQVRAIEVRRQADQAALDFRVQDLRLQEQELSIQNAVNAGILTEAQGKQATLALQREYRDLLIQSLRIQQQALDPFSDGEAFQRIQVQIEQLKTLGQELTPTQGFLKGFRSEAETLAESFERAGKAFKDSILGVLDSGIDKLTSKLGFLKGLVGDLLKSFARAFIGNLFQPRGGAASGGGGGGGGLLGNIFGGLLGGGGGGGSFLTGGFAGGGGAASILGGGGSSGGILGALTQSLGLGPSVPRSLSLGGLPIAPNIPFPSALTGGGSGSGGGGILGSLGLNFSGLFKGFGFGQAPGSQLGALASAAPLLGIGLGASLGTDRLTSILGGAAGGLLGIGLTAAPAGLAGGALGFLAPLFSNPITAIAAAAALPVIFLLGRARQRKRDERSSGDFLQDAVDQIRDIRKQVESNELTLSVAEARNLFNSQVLEPFVAQINTLKTKSVRESRLKNQTADLRALFEKEVIPAVQAQKARIGISDKLIPEFAYGGIVPGMPTPGIDSVLARVSPGEMVLTVQHQRAISAMAGGDVFSRVGVPNAGSVAADGSQGFARGGIVAASTRAEATPTINMTVQLVVSADDAVEILNAAAITDDGQQILVNARRGAQWNRLTR